MIIKKGKTAESTKNAFRARMVWRGFYFIDVSDHAIPLLSANRGSPRGLKRSNTYLIYP